MIACPSLVAPIKNRRSSAWRSWVSDGHLSYKLPSVVVGQDYVVPELCSYTQITKCGDSSLHPSLLCPPLPRSAEPTPFLGPNRAAQQCSWLLTDEHDSDHCTIMSQSLTCCLSCWTTACPLVLAVWSSFFSLNSCCSIYNGSLSCLHVVTATIYFLSNLL